MPPPKCGSDIISITRATMSGSHVKAYLRYTLFIKVCSHSKGIIDKAEDPHCRNPSTQPKLDQILGTFTKSLLVKKKFTNVRKVSSRKIKVSFTFVKNCGRASIFFLTLACHVHTLYPRNLGVTSLNCGCKKKKASCASNLHPFL